ncbi:DUF3592 domain-containing protein [Amycolatopsis sp. NPDC059021]|uniref:DUF3592 domain-containing protein n=1 Tax=Amycolatopsis sp. NPDC059021 TaxID=3346704 RepID=UPI00366FB677
MGPGFDGGVQVRDDGHGGVAYAVACGAASLLFVVSATVTAAGFIVSDRPWERDWFPLAIVVTVVSPFCAVIAGVLVWRSGGGGEFAAAATGSVVRIPPAGADPPGVFDPGAELRRVRMMTWRALGFVVLSCAILLAALWCLAALVRAPSRLLETGQRVPGSVLEVEKHRGTGVVAIQVRYPVGDTTRVARIATQGGRSYSAGQPVTVIYDPGNPGHVRTPGEPNEEWVVIGLCTAAGLVALLSVPASLAAATGWWRRYRAVRRTGWRAAAVAVRPGPPLLTWLAPDLHVRFRDGGGMVLGAAVSTHQISRVDRDLRRDGRVWVGGTGRHVVVMVRREALPGLYVLPVRVRREEPRRPGG